MPRPGVIKGNRRGCDPRTAKRSGEGRRRT
nr:MAG TPA: hypothetical protein [Caudoviricetes sp.]